MVRAMTCFNPVLGFLGVATSSTRYPPSSVAMFQSRSGFSGCRDAERGERDASGLLVSIPFWVFWVSRRGGCCYSNTTVQVSIPFWVFWVSRPTRKAGTFPDTTSFNPVLGFLGVATYVASRGWPSRRCFNPVLGFLGVATSSPFLSVLTDERFQSRSGFSGCRDRTSHAAHRRR